MSPAKPLISVNELMYLYYAGSEEALKALISYFRPALHRMLHASVEQQPFSVSEEDFFSEADLLLVECLEKFRTGTTHTFTGYYKKAILNRLTDGKRSRGSCTYIETEHFSLDKSLKEGTSATYLSDWAAPDNVHEQVLLKTQIDNGLEKLEKTLTRKEYQCILWKMEGKSNRAIARASGFSCNKISRLLLRARTFFDVDVQRAI